MALLPDDKVGRIEFGEDHIAGWVSNAVAIGTTSSATTDLQTKITAARAAYEAQRLAQNAAKDATVTLNMAADAMSTAIMSIVGQVRAKAALVGDSVYALASIPAPAIPSPTPAPGKVTNFAYTLDETGTLNMTWKADNPRKVGGTMYQIYRSLTGPNGDFAYVGSAGVKKFADATIPAGTTTVTYQIQALRSTAAGPWAKFVATLGTGGVSELAVDATPMKRAA